MLKEKLKQNEIIDYLYICMRNIRSKEERAKIIDAYRGTNHIKIQRYGDKNYGNLIYMADPVGSYTSGFFSNLLRTLFKFAFAHAYGMYPVTYKGKMTHYAENELFLGTDNFFEYFFEQPSGISVNDALQSCAVAWDNALHIAPYENLPLKEQDEILIKEIKKSLVLKKDTLLELEKSREKFIKKERILGVKYRGTDYNCKYKGHPIFISVEELIEQIKKVYEEGYDKIYLATEDKEALKKFILYFGNELLYDEEILRSDIGQMHIDMARSDPNCHTAYLEGLNVLKDVWVLSHATSFVGTQCGVTRFVSLFNKAFDAIPFSKSYIIDKGVYKKGANSVKEANKKYKLK